MSTADGGGTHGSRGRLGQVAWQRLAAASGWRIAVCYWPPRMSKGHHIAYRMVGPITEHGRGRPWVSREGVVTLLGHPTTPTGLTIRSAWDEHRYPPGREGTDPQREPFHHAGHVARRME